MEKQVIQSVGFRNIVSDGKVTGFQLKIRLPYYRGVYLSQVKVGSLVVDGEEITKDHILWRLGGSDYTWQEMLQARQVHWHPLELVTLIVDKPGGLQQGYHDLKYSYACTHSYMPPMMEEMMSPFKEETVYLVEFGHTHHTRRLLIV
ncbi:MAG: DUF6379 domain-containing protein [Bacteroidales bacterium]|nr:hypothetical protein [Bacteroidaceae bacterium]MBQ9884820.1 hypothetical protein [Bacteroidaceae bacterium]MBR3626379.1 hypothetical protein [Bacteroidaceae bacterium]MBR3717532.1 hypothetical protein [Bacteroidaceae bacterium]MDO4186929.1 DUF6379 domain-containing protein [Bacteroidales bacterium]